MISSLMKVTLEAQKHRNYELRLVVRKPVFEVFDQVRHKPGCTATEGGLRLEISDLDRSGIALSTDVAKTKALISFAVTAKLICVFVFEYGLGANLRYMGYF